MSGIRKKNVWALSMHIAIANFNFCYSLGAFNSCADNVSTTLNWGSMKDTYIAIFSTMIPAGAFISSSVSGLLLEKYGRRGSLILSDWVFILGCLLSSLPSTIFFGLGRFLCGIGSGLFLTISPVYLNEITPDILAAQTGPIIQIFNCISFIVAFGLSLILPTENYVNDDFNYFWSVIFIFPGLLAIYQLGYFLFIMKLDSPKWYLDNNEQEKAQEILEYVYMPESLEIGLLRFGSKKKIQNKDEKLVISYKSLFTEGKYRKMLRNGIMLAIIQQLSGINAAFFYSTDIFNRLGGKDIAMARVYTFIMGIVNMIAGIISLPLLDKFGRKPLIISGEYLLMVSCVLLGYFSDTENLNLLGSLICIYLYILFFSYSMAGAFWTYLSELCVDKALAVTTAVNLLFTCVITIGFPFVVNEFGISTAFYSFAGMLFLSIFYCHWDLVETKDKTKPQILAMILGE
ncbi:hypothetical protein SteCoe_37286 [Stentor coeruleus]|uniref:Hexose transporter 1 n=1 Tax=Stentor coeruleus TaxID=5963 RepID=A0A1R2ANB0_9CILI|nr:hypothetical protein SteCoe_37286 [Stentor coeruleus]